MGCPQVLKGRELKDAGKLNVHCFLNHLNEIFHDEHGAISKGPSCARRQVGVSGYTMFDELSVVQVSNREVLP